MVSECHVCNPTRRTGADILDVAQRLGARLKRVGAAERAGPCPKCGGQDRFSVNTALGVWNCRHCARGGDGIALARHVLGITFAEALAFVGDERADAPAPYRSTPRPQPAPPPAEPDAAKVAQALALWEAAADPRGTLAETYLNSRGLGLDAAICGGVLRWHSGAGAMLALFRNVASGEPQAVSRTYLSATGEKLSRKFLGPVGGAAIMFDPPADELTVAEGVETAMTARALGFGPAWALGSAGAIATLLPVAGVVRLRILIERDENGANQKAAAACAGRWQTAGRVVRLSLPPPRCADFNDAVRQDRR